MDWVIKQLQATNSQLNRSAKNPRLNICYHDNEIVSIDKSIIDSVSKQEQYIELAKELGPNSFNDWYIETFGEPSPHIDMKVYKGVARFKSPRDKIKQEIIDDLKEV